MKLVIVPNCVRDAINAAINKALEAVPEAACDREVFYQQLLNYYDEHGRIPDFSLQKKSL